MRNISQAALRNVRVPLVSAAKQQEAIEVFKRADDAIRQLEAAIASHDRRSRALRRAVLAAAFKGRLTGRRTDHEVIEELADV